MADPARLAAIGEAVRARLLADPRAEPRGGHRADLFTLPGFLPQADCQALIDAIDAAAVPSTLYREGKTPGIRTSSTHYFRADPRALDLGQALDHLLGLERSQAETMQGQRYRVGEEYRHHCDFFREKRTHWQTERLRGGQRSWTAMLYLNAPQAGGATDFPKLGLAITPEPGMLVVWNNMDRAGRPNRAVLHAGTPVLAGVKHVITQWYRLHPRAPAGAG
ncbi:2OG-Fe(II) oxygenase [Qipengyuania sediminis]|uniref:2OG-Fe(II) oxygenase n=1 Tax=Qipengyuania sediminis TaxID=1532023 RepID=UPI00105A0959|nr:2OG-Fe(II) oxygenase [Qipengyuania sediminis]